MEVFPPLTFPAQHTILFHCSASPTCCMSHITRTHGHAATTTEQSMSSRDLQPPRCPEGGESTVVWAGQWWTKHITLIFSCWSPGSSSLCPVITLRIRQVEGGREDIWVGYDPSHLFECSAVMCEQIPFLVGFLNLFTTTGMDFPSTGSLVTCSPRPFCSSVVVNELSHVVLVSWVSHPRVHDYIFLYSIVTATLCSIPVTWWCPLVGNLQSRGYFFNIIFIFITIIDCRCSITITLLITEIKACRLIFPLECVVLTSTCHGEQSSRVVSVMQSLMWQALQDRHLLIPHLWLHTTGGIPFVWEWIFCKTAFGVIDHTELKQTCCVIWLSRNWWMHREHSIICCKGDLLRFEYWCFVYLSGSYFSFSSRLLHPLSYFLFLALYFLFSSSRFLWFSWLCVSGFLFWLPVFLLPFCLDSKLFVLPNIILYFEASSPLSSQSSSIPCYLPHAPPAIH